MGWVTSLLKVFHPLNRIAILEDQLATAKQENSALKAENADFKKKKEEAEAAVKILSERDVGYNYVSDLAWPGTATHKDDPSKRVCEHCLKTKKVELALIWDRVNQLWTCAGCGTHLNKP
jgi:hypothetical protein